MKFLVKTSYFNFDKKGNAKMIQPGTVLTQKEYDKLTQPKKDKCELIDSTRSAYTDDQASFLFDSYLEFGGNEKAVLLAFFNEFGHVHPVGSVSSKIRRISVNDPSKENDTEWQSDRQIDSLTSMVW
jgi:hypothetical protein